MPQWDREIVLATQSAFRNKGNATTAAGAARYMKHIAPFIGIQTPERRKLTKKAWETFRPPTSNELGDAAIQLFALPEREYHYAAYDLISKWINQTDEYFLTQYVEPLLTTKSWWDTVDGLVNAAVSPLCFRYDARAIINAWSSSKNRWLVRAAIGHQRGWKNDTQVEFIFSVCSKHWSDQEFFVAKAIGWALRDIARVKPSDVKRFLRNHPDPNPVAVREARRGLVE